MSGRCVEDVLKPQLFPHRIYSSSRYGSRIYDSTSTSIATSGFGRNRRYTCFLYDQCLKVPAQIRRALWAYVCCVSSSQYNAISPSLDHDICLRYFLQQNAAIEAASVDAAKINLKYLGIGNGLTVRTAAYQALRTTCVDLISTGSSCPVPWVHPIRYGESLPPTR